MAYLAEKDSDPVFAESMEDQLGKITGDVLLKATTVVQFLSEECPLEPLLYATWPKPTDDRPTRAAAFEKALGEPLRDLEVRWKAWLLCDPELSVIERLKGGDAGGIRDLTPDENNALLKLNAVRARAGHPKVSLDLELSRGCRAHALYLTKNPKQAAMWPEAHEEFPDCDGFTVEGAWAGLHSVIAPGFGHPERAIDCWMGTFYHRLPLLEPLLLQIGWGVTGDVAVLDAGSLVVPPQFETTVPWPPADAKGIPTRFCPELPNPVPGEDQSRWGYPVTLQLWTVESDLAVEVDLTLHRGKDTGPRVDCHFSSPQDPTNPLCAPRNAWCLIPKAPLKPGATYTVVARIRKPGEEIFTWSFETGK